MRKHIYWGKVFNWTSILIVSGLMVSNTCFSKEMKTVAVLPFTMNTQQDLTFLQKGIFDMFLSRITYGDDVLVLTRENLENKLGKADDPSLAVTKGINEAKAKTLGQFLDVDYVLFGSLTLFGESMSLDVNMVDIKTGQPSLIFFRQSDNAGAVIPELNKICEEINYKVFGRETIEFKGQQAALAQVYEQQGENFKSPLSRFQTLLNFKGTINGVATGDLDGDKKNEVVIIDGNMVQIYKVGMNQQLIPIQKIENESSAVTCVSIDVADINQNGFAEIFVTGVNDRQERASSFVIEFNGTKYVRAKKTYPWYFRVIKDANRKSQLFAQSHSKKGPWYPNAVFNVISSNNTYEQGSGLSVPRNGFSILSMVKVTEANKQTSSYLYTDKEGRLVSFNESGKVEWSSDEGYGGSILSYRFPQDHSKSLEWEVAFFQPKNIIFDKRSDGKLQLFVIKNKETSDYLFANARSFKRGSVEIHSFNDMGLSSENAPKKFAGMVTSMDIGDYDNDSKMELLVTMIKKGKDMFSSDVTSIMVAYELE